MLPKSVPAFFLRTKQKNLLISSKTKLLIVLIIIISSYLSGKIPFLNKRDNTQVLSETTIDFSPKDNKEVDSEKSKQIQIKQISIGQRVFTPPTPTLTTTPIPASTSDNTWGVAEKIDSHTYTMRLRSDGVMGTPQEILSALNIYRQQHGRGALTWDDTLANFANTRVEYFSQKGRLDNHAGFLDYLNNQEGFKKLGFANVGENSSIGFTLEGVHIIEWVYAGDAEHDNNQLNSDWHYAGIGVNGNATDLVFAGDKL